MFFLFQAEDGIRYLVRSRGLGDVYKRQDLPFPVKVLGQDVESATDVEWLFWVGCAGAYEDLSLIHI